MDIRTTAPNWYYDLLQYSNSLQTPYNTACVGAALIPLKYILLVIEFSEDAHVCGIEALRLPLHVQETLSDEFCKGLSNTKTNAIHGVVMLQTLSKGMRLCYCFQDSVFIGHCIAADRLGTIRANAIAFKFQCLQTVAMLQTFSKGHGTIRANIIVSNIQCLQTVAMLQTLSKGLCTIRANIQHSVSADCCNAAHPVQGPWHDQNQFFRFSVFRLLQCGRPSARALAPSEPIFQKRMQAVAMRETLSKGLGTISHCLQHSVSADCCNTADPQQGPWHHQNQCY